MSTDSNTRIYRLEKSIDYLEKAEEKAPYPEWARDIRSTINDRRREINGLRHPEVEIRNNPEKIKEIKSKISNIKSEINNLEEKCKKKFLETGEIAYPECKEKSSELAIDSKIKLEAILAIDTLIDKTIKEIENIKGRDKKSGFFAKLGDTVTSTAKQGKLKLDLYNFERQKKSAFTDFGEALYKSQNNGGNTLTNLSNIFNEIKKIENQINENESEINQLNKLL